MKVQKIPHIGLTIAFNYEEEEKCDEAGLKQELSKISPHNMSVNSAYKDYLEREYERKEQEKEEERKKILVEAPVCTYAQEFNYEKCKRERAEYFKKHGLEDPQEKEIQDILSIMDFDNGKSEEKYTPIEDIANDIINRFKKPCDHLFNFPDSYEACIKENESEWKAY